MPDGAVAEWLGRGLQSLAHQFDSGRRLFSQRTIKSTAYIRIDRAMWPNIGPYRPLYFASVRALTIRILL